MLLANETLASVLVSLGLTPATVKPLPAPSSSSSTSASMNTAASHRPVSGFEAQQGLETITTSRVSNTLCAIEPYNASVSLASPQPFDQAKAMIYRYRQQQSVNLGSLFVQEQWMVPSLFICASGEQMSELDVASGWGSADAARQVLERHCDTFVTEDDIRSLAAVGINSLRLPIGYWTLGPTFCQGTPFESVASVYQNSWPRVLRLIEWAETYNMGVLIDLHGAPGSQNGQPHSGISDGQVNLFNDPSNMQKTTEVLKFLTAQLVSMTNCVGIEILNEPKNVPELADFYAQVISDLRAVSTYASGFPFYIHDAFDLGRFSDFVSNRKDFVVQDHHSYFVYSQSDTAKSASQHTYDVDTTIQHSLANSSSSERRNLIIGEWSCALTPNSLVQEADAQVAQAAFCRTQMDVYSNSTAGWSFWSFDKEGCSTDPGWCFKSASGTTLPSSFPSYSSLALPNPPSFQAVLTNVSLPSYHDFATRHLAAALKDSAHGHQQTSHDHFFPTQGARRHAKRHVVRRIVAISSRQLDRVPPEQDVASKGYSDGFLTATAFAREGLSKLGFTGQYIQDSFALLPFTSSLETTYQDWFLNGLHDGESRVALSIAQLPGAT